MCLNIEKFYQNCDPKKPLNYGNTEDKSYYIDFASVRGVEVIQELKDSIEWDENHTYQLFTGQIGCGKTTELWRLKTELEQDNWGVVFLDTNIGLDVNDVRLTDLLIFIACGVSDEYIKNTEENFLEQCFPTFQNIFNQILNIIDRRLIISEIGLSVGLATITAQVKQNSTIRDRLSNQLGMFMPDLIRAINEEVIRLVIDKLRNQGKKGLVVIVDGLDKMIDLTQAGSLFIDRTQQLRSFRCHIIYTIPMSLVFSDRFQALLQNFAETPKVLPMIPVRRRNGGEHEEGMELLKEMVLKRVFPDLQKDQLFEQIPLLFESDEALNRLCRVSGGHVRYILLYLREWIKSQKTLPLSQPDLEEIIVKYCSDICLGITEEDWELLCQVAKTQEVAGAKYYERLIHSLFVYKYDEQGQAWFDVNPILAESKKMKEKCQVEIEERNND
ncbi:MAG: ATP-binding protein [Microcystis aeruginosa Ma_MB_F_20061100_S20]|uniref:ATP-binding protein n=1 Tax=Microcystis aeruginosa Ma_MB_F_20061100_S20D TaxID=2486253 RepID=A0A552EEZ5_MICAE|nr:MAG: ATP-binding protein [Microcystis aeruginosa Ma_MB_F_20061100_S20D]TRU34565.1 MAG: ATP-binding protein [Microcystis aeruginosa Ma_MB_F_20061100_S20]